MAVEPPDEDDPLEDDPLEDELVDPPAPDVLDDEEDESELLLDALSLVPVLSDVLDREALRLSVR